MLNHRLATMAVSHHLKINELFNYRRLPWLVQLSRMHDDQSFYQHLVKLQDSIYALDHYLETSWQLSGDRLWKFWQDIYRDLSPFGLAKGEKFEFTSSIQIYQSHEINLRRRLSPSHLKMSDFYHHKSCDIKLMRKLIYRTDPTIKQLIHADDWILFDLLTEIHDDIEDLYEDLKIFNANRFLYMLLQQNRVEVQSLYENFIKAIKEKAGIWIQKNPSVNGERMTIYRITEDMASETLELLDRRLRNLNSEDLVAAWDQ